MYACLCLGEKTNSDQENMEPSETELVPFVSVALHEQQNCFDIEILRMTRTAVLFQNSREMSVF